MERERVICRFLYGAHNEWSLCKKVGLACDSCPDNLAIPEGACMAFEIPEGMTLAEVYETYIKPHKEFLCGGGKGIKYTNKRSEQNGIT